MQCRDERKPVTLKLLNHGSAVEPIRRYPNDVSGCGDVVYEPCPDDLYLQSDLHYGADQQMPVPDSTWPLREYFFLPCKSRNFIWSENVVQEICACHSHDPFRQD
jgi:hypothetical protein